MRKYTITGVDKENKRFVIHTNTPQHFNIWKGTLWENVFISKDHWITKHKLIKRYYN